MNPEDSYWNCEGTRFLNPDNSIPSVEERVKAAFSAGYQAGKEAREIPDPEVVS